MARYWCSIMLQKRLLASRCFIAPKLDCHSKPCAVVVLHLPESWYQYVVDTDCFVNHSLFNYSLFLIIVYKLRVVILNNSEMTPVYLIQPLFIHFSLCFITTIRTALSKWWFSTCIHISTTLLIIIKHILFNNNLSIVINRHINLRPLYRRHLHQNVWDVT